MYCLVLVYPYVYRELLSAQDQDLCCSSHTFPRYWTLLAMASPILHMCDNLVQRNDSVETDESPFASGLTTPVDEDVLQPFDQLDRLLVDYDAEVQGTPKPPRYHLKDDGFATPKSHHSIKSNGFVQVVAQLTGKNSESHNVPTTPSIDANETVSPSMDSPDVSPNFGSVGVRRLSIYSLPNASISVEALKNFGPEAIESSPLISITPPSDASISGLEADHTTSTTQDDLAQEQAGSPDLLAALAQEYSMFSECSNLTPKDVLSLVIKVICFLPWCVAVGGAIVLCPRHLELVAFSPGYILSPKGIYRFAHWADCAMHHVMIFFAFLAAVVWWNPSVGLILAAGVTAQFVVAWHDFVVDRTIPLGDDDLQTMYLLATNYGLEEDSLSMKKTEAGYLVFPLERGQVFAESDEE